MATFAPPARSRFASLWPGKRLSRWFLARLKQRLAEKPRKVMDTFVAIFGRKIALDEQGMATGEALAHLNCLIYRGEVKSAAGPDGVTLYSLAT